MPHKDPVTGCTVLSIAEFWQHEAASEGRGRSGADLMTEFFQELAQDANTQATRYRSDLAYTRAELQKALADFNLDLPPEDQLPPLLDVLEVVDADVRDGLRNSSLFLRVRALRQSPTGAVEDLLTLAATYHYGSRLDPPDEETTVEWESLRTPEDA